MTLHQLEPKFIDEGVAGELANLSQLTESTNFPHTPGKATEAYTVKVDSAANDTTYSYEVNGQTVEFTSDASATLAEIADGLAAAHNADIIARGVGEANSDGVDTVTITGSFANEGVLDVSTSDANLTVAEDTAAGGWTEIPFGRAIVVDSNGQANLPANGASASDFEGIAKRQLDERSEDLNSPASSYTSPRPVVAVITGDVYVEDEDGASKGDAVWIGTDAGEKGKFFTSDNTGSTRVQITDGSFEWKRAGVIRVKLGL